MDAKKRLEMKLRGRVEELKADLAETYEALNHIMDQCPWFGIHQTCAFGDHLTSAKRIQQLEEHVVALNLNHHEDRFRFVTRTQEMEREVQEMKLKVAHLNTTKAELAALILHTRSLEGKLKRVAELKRQCCKGHLPAARDAAVERATAALRLELQNEREKNAALQLELQKEREKNASAHS